MGQVLQNTPSFSLFAVNISSHSLSLSLAESLSLSPSPTVCLLHLLPLFTNLTKSLLYYQNLFPNLLPIVPRSRIELGSTLEASFQLVLGRRSLSLQIFVIFAQLLRQGKSLTFLCLCLSVYVQNVKIEGCFGCDLSEKNLSWVAIVRDLLLQIRI